MCEIALTSKQRASTFSLYGSKGYLEMAHLLLRKGTSIQTTEHEDWTALQFAAENGHSYVAELLHEGADIKEEISEE